MVAISDGWRQFYNSAAQQSTVDPGLVTAIAISESGWSANGGQSGPVNLGIDSNGTPGLPGVASGVGNSTHRFYTYRSGLEAAQGLAAYWNTPLYASSGIFGMPVESQAQAMVSHGYSGCPGPECDAQWGNKILSIRSSVVGAFGAPDPGNAIVPTPSPGGGFNPDPGPIGTIPMPGGPTPPGTPRTPADANPCAAAGAAVLATLPGGATIKAGPLGEAFCRIGNAVAFFEHPGTWWAILFFAGGLAAVLAGVLIYFKGDLGQVARVAVAG